MPILLLIALLLASSSAPCTHASYQAGGPVAASGADERRQVLIGVLSHRGDERTRQAWQPTADYLSAHIPAYRFVVAPLDFDAVDPTVAGAAVDFVLVNPAIYVQLELHHGVSRIATLRNGVGEQSRNLFGGVIFTRLTSRVLQLNQRLSRANTRLERRQQLILDSVAEGIYGVDLQGRATFVNKAMERMTGWRSEELIGNDQHEIIHHTRADGEPHIRATNARCTPPFATTRPASSMMTVLAPRRHQLSGGIQRHTDPRRARRDHRQRRGVSRHHRPTQGRRADQPARGRAGAFLAPEHAGRDGLGHRPRTQPTADRDHHQRPRLRAHDRIRACDHADLQQRHDQDRRAGGTRRRGHSPDSPLRPQGATRDLAGGRSTTSSRP
jgi:PAS domain-containing protein